MRKIIVELAHDLLDKYINKEDILVDATMGNGNDTLFLAKRASHVYAFDIQDEALNNTYEKVKDFNNVTLIKDSFENIYNYVTNFKGVVFNLGYLPKGDKNITTKSEITLKTFKMLINNLINDQFILYVIYPGHKEGMEESLSLQNQIKMLDSTFKVLKIELLNQDNNPPYIIFIKKEK